MKGASLLRFIAIFGFSQILSLLITSTGVFSQLLAKEGVNIPTSQSFANYIFLSIIYVPYMLYKRRSLKTVIPWYVYVFIALADVEGNYLVVKAYQYTSITSVQLLDCFTIPSVMLFSWILLRKKYSPAHFVGVAVCVGGMGSLVVGDYYRANSNTSGPSPLQGDLLCMAGAACYALSNAALETVMKCEDWKEVKDNIRARFRVCQGTSAKLEGSSRGVLDHSIAQSSIPDSHHPAGRGSVLSDCSDSFANTALLSQGNLPTPSPHPQRKGQLRTDPGGGGGRGAEAQADSLETGSLQVSFTSARSSLSSDTEPPEPPDPESTPGSGGGPREGDSGRGEAGRSALNESTVTSYDTRAETAFEPQREVRGAPTWEWLAMIGIFGSCINGIQLALLERDELKATDWSDPQIRMYLAGFSVALFLLYSAVPAFVLMSSATFMNLSFLSSDFFAVLASVLLFKDFMTSLYFVSFAVIVLGLTIYHWDPELPCSCCRKRQPDFEVEAELEGDGDTYVPTSDV